MSNRLIIFVEGKDDERLVSQFVFPIITSHFSKVEIYRYAEKVNKLVRTYLASVQYNGWNFWFFADLDSFPCITKRKEDLRKNIFHRKLRMKIF